MRLAKLAAGAQRYYLATVAAGAEDNRPGGLEPDGLWLGSGSGGLRLDGTVSASALEAVLAGVHPESGEPLNPAQPRVRVVGYDLVFAAPKSVSLLFGVAAADVSAKVSEAHEASVLDALGYLERRALSARRRVGGTRSSVATHGAIAAGFVHRTSRAADPHLHTHVLVANLVEGEDERWSALDARGLYAHGLTAGYLYQARLRHELSLRTGVAFGPVRKGVADVAGIRAEALAHFSQRRAQVQAQLDAWGASSQRAAQMAALVTRPAKDTSRSVVELRHEWRGRARALGLSEDNVRSVLGRVPPTVTGSGAVAGDAELDALDVDSMLAGLVERDGSFGRRELLRCLSQALVTGADVATIEGLAERVLTLGKLVERTAPAERWLRRDGRSLMSGVVEDRWSTAARIRAEAAFVQEAAERALPAGRAITDGPAFSDAPGLPVPPDAPGLPVPPSGSCPVPQPVLRATLDRRPELSEDQVVAVRRLVFGDSGLEVVWSEPGPGRSDVLEAAREAWEHAGYRVVGAATTDTVGTALESSTGIEVPVPGASEPASEGFAPARQRALSDGRPAVVVVADAQAWQLDALRALVRAHEGAKVVLMAEPGRVGPASGAMERLRRSAGVIEVSRPRVPALERGPAPVRVSVDPGREVVVGLSAPALRRAAVEDWWRAYSQGGAAVMVAQGRAEIEALNRGARAMLREAGRLGDDVVVSGRMELAVGDSVALRWGHDRHGLPQGGTARVVGLVESLQTPLTSARAIVLAGDDAHRVSIPLASLRPGQLVHAYAMSPVEAARRSQTRCLVLGGPEVMESVPGHESERSVVHYYVLGPQVLGRDGPWSASAHQGPGQLGRPDQLLELARRWPELAGPPQSGELARSLAVLGGEVDQLRAELLGGLPVDPGPARAVLEEERAAVGLGMANARTLAPALLPRWQAAAERVEERGRELARADVRREVWVDDHRDQLARYATLSRTLGERQAVLGRAAEVALPAHVLALLGPRPVEPGERTHWREAAGAIQGFRERWGITDAQQTLGREHFPEPRRALERGAVEQLVQSVQRRLGLGLGLSHERQRERGVERGLERHLQREAAHTLGP